ncbi:16212_t:CDS:1, partial [Acaulospora morrowiae]
DKLIITQAELDHSEQMLKEHAEALEEADRIREHDLNTAASLQKYIVELETKLEKHESGVMLRENRDGHPEKFISETVRLLEQRLQESEEAYKDLEIKLMNAEHENNNNERIETLERLLQEKEDDYNSLEEKFKLLDCSAEKKSLMDQSEVPRSPITQSIGGTDQNNLLTVLALESKLSEVEKAHEESVSELTVLKKKHNECLDQIKDLQSKLEENQEPIVERDSSLEQKLTKMQDLYNRNLTSLADSRLKYQASLQLIQELQSQLEESKRKHSEMMEDLRSFSSTPISPITSITCYSDSPRDDATPSQRSSVTAFSGRSSLHRKAVSMSASMDLKGSDKCDLEYSAIMEKLQFELKLFESSPKDKPTSLDAIRHELSRLEIKHLETVQVLDGIREELERRDALATLQISSMTNAGSLKDDKADTHSEGRSTPITSQADELDIVQRLRGEVNTLKEKQRKVMENIFEREKENKLKSVEVHQLQSSIGGLREQLRVAIEEKLRHTENTNGNGEKDYESHISELLSKVKELEAQLAIVQGSNHEPQGTAPEVISYNNVIEDENEKRMVELREQVEKLQVEIQAKSDTIATLLLPNNEQENQIQRLEEELREFKEAHRLAIQEKNHDSHNSPDARTSPDIGAHENATTLGNTVKDLEIQLIRVKGQHSAPSSKRSSMMFITDPIQRTFDIIHSNLEILQQELNAEHSSIDCDKEKECVVDSKKDLVSLMQSNFEVLRSDIKRKNDLVETLKRDLVDKSLMQQKLHENEVEIEVLTQQLSVIKVQNKGTQKQIEELLEQLTEAEKNSKEAQKLLESELKNIKEEHNNLKKEYDNVRKEYDNVKNSNSSTIEELKEEIDRLRAEKLEQDTMIKTYETQLELLAQGDPDMAALRKELAELKTIESRLKERVQELELQIEIADAKSKRLQNMKDELRTFKEGDIDKDIIIEQLQHQVADAKEAKDAVVNEWTSMKESFQTQTKLVITLEGGLQTLMDELNLTKKNHTATLQEVEELTSFLTTIMQKHESDEKKIELLEKEVSELKGINRKDPLECREKLEVPTHEIKSQGKILSELERQIVDLEKEKETLSRNLLERENQQKEIAAEFEEKIEKLNQQVNSLNVMIKEKEQLIESKDSLLEELNNKILPSSTLTNNTENAQSLLVKELENALKEHETRLIEVNSRLEQAKESEVQQTEKIKMMESQLQESRSQRDEEIKAFREQCTFLKNVIESARENEAISGELKSQFIQRIEALEGMINERENEDQCKLQFELEEQIKTLKKNYDLLNENFTEVANKFVDAEVISQEQKERIVELEAALRDANEQKTSQLDSSLDVNKRNSVLENPKFARLSAVTENLQQHHENLTSKISEVGFCASSLTDNLKNLEVEIDQLKSLDDVESVDVLKERITKLKSEKEDLKQVNEALFEEKNDVDHKIKTVLDQLKMASQDGSRTAAYIAELNTKLELLEGELVSLRQHPSIEKKKKETIVNDNSQSNNLDISDPQKEKYIKELQGKVVDLERQLQRSCADNLTTFSKTTRMEIQELYKIIMEIEEERQKVEQSLEKEKKAKTNAEIALRELQKQLETLQVSTKKKKFRFLCV